MVETVCVSADIGAANALGPDVTNVVALSTIIPRDDLSKVRRRRDELLDALRIVELADAIVELADSEVFELKRRPCCILSLALFPLTSAHQVASNDSAKASTKREKGALTHHVNLACRLRLALHAQIRIRRHVRDALVLRRPRALPAEKAIRIRERIDNAIWIAIGKLRIIKVRHKVRRHAGIGKRSLPSTVRIRGAKGLGAAVEGADEWPAVDVEVAGAALVLRHERKELRRIRVAEGIHVEAEEQTKGLGVCGVEERGEGALAWVGVCREAI